MFTVTATQLHDRTAELTERVAKRPEEPIVVEKRGKRVMVLVDADYFEGLIETLDILSDPQAMADIRAGLADIAAGRMISHAEVAKEFGLNVGPIRKRPVDRTSTRRAGAHRKSNRPAKVIR